MIIGVKYWNYGGSAPANFTNLDVVECDLTDSVVAYDEGEALDHTLWSYKTIRYTCTLEIGPLSFNHGTYGPIALALRKANFARINDSRDAAFGTSTTIDFIVRGSRPVRSARSNITRGVVITLDAVVVHT